MVKYNDNFRPLLQSYFSRAQLLGSVMTFKHAFVGVGNEGSLRSLCPSREFTGTSHKVSTRSE
eukprot:3348090-Amphidinium_carterae.1